MQNLDRRYWDKVLEFFESRVLNNAFIVLTFSVYSGLRWENEWKNGLRVQRKDY